MWRGWGILSCINRGEFLIIIPWVNSWAITSGTSGLVNDMALYNSITIKYCRVAACIAKLVEEKTSYSGVF